MKKEWRSALIEVDIITADLTEASSLRRYSINLPKPHIPNYCHYAMYA
jgi:hypothetical protein